MAALRTDVADLDFGGTVYDVLLTDMTCDCGASVRPNYVVALPRIKGSIARKLCCVACAERHGAGPVPADVLAQSQALLEGEGP